MRTTKESVPAGTRSARRVDIRHAAPFPGIANTLMLRGGWVANPGAHCGELGFASWVRHGSPPGAERVVFVLNELLSRLRVECSFVLPSNRHVVDRASIGVIPLPG